MTYKLIINYPLEIAFAHTQVEQSINGMLKAKHLPKIVSTGQGNGLRDFAIIGVRNAGEVTRCRNIIKYTFAGNGIDEYSIKTKKEN